MTKIYEVTSSKTGRNYELTEITRVKCGHRYSVSYKNMFMCTFGGDCFDLKRLADAIKFSDDKLDHRMMTTKAYDD